MALFLSRETLRPGDLMQSLDRSVYSYVWIAATVWVPIRGDLYALRRRA